MSLPPPKWLRIRVWSDLHLEMRRNLSVLERIPSEIDADLLILAGDIANGVDGVRWVAENFPALPVAYVLGNHELYGHDLMTLYDACRDEAAGTLVRVLEREAWDASPSVRLLGATLWTDFTLWGADRVDAAEAAALGMSDYWLIQIGDRRLTPADTRRIHHETRRWLEVELARAAADRVTAIVVTHHAPHHACLSDRHVRSHDPLSPAFATDLTELLTGPNAPAVWCAGHTHHNHGGVVVGTHTQLVSNQAGYVFRNESEGFIPEGLVLNVGRDMPNAG